ncbi:MAG TPA: DUF2795 domain-containing protein [Pseudonocardia sp.]|nr:DUF2795 domain-containing protein [Pseudonocardia sp.]
MPISDAAPRPSESVRPRATSGVHTQDLSHVGRVLSGLSYPVERWELLDHVSRGEDPAAVLDQRLRRRTVDQLWTLPNRRYRSLDEVLVALALTVRGHPPRRSD